MKKQNFKNKKTNYKKTAGITLIALVVTIIVLLILAGISIMMLSGNNGILTRAGQAREETEMAQLKEQAELIRNTMLIDKTLNGTGDLTRNELVAGISSDSFFKGSTRSGYKVVTAGEKYDVNVGADLSITVTKHVATVGKEIILTLTEEETESRAALLKVTATIDGVEEPTATSLEEKLDPNGEENTTELRNMTLKAYNIALANFGMSFKSYEDIETTIFEGNNTKPKDAYQMLKNEGITTAESLYAFLIETGAYKPDIILTCSNGEEITVEESGEFVVATNGTYTVTATDEDGDYGEGSKAITKCDVEVYSDIQTATTTITTKDGKSVPVPAGFAYGNDNNVGKLSTGLVITDSVDGNHNSTGNEFVWIPVDKDTLKVYGTDKVIAKISTGNFAGTDSKGNTNYEGVLYENFSGTSSDVMSNYGQNDNNYYYREPALVTDYDNDTSKPSDSEQTYLGQIGLTADQFKTEMVENYNAMIKSIQTYGGFYVARYEMGVKKGTVVISKLGVNPATSFDETTKYWYGLYSKAKTYTTSSVQSSMIWGSQYDAMLNFALKGADKAKVVATTNGNHGGTQTKTGAYKGSDCINNIYDLEGNEWEWTLETYDTYRRAGRGGDFSYARSPSYRSNDNPNYDNISFGSRATLYIR